MKLAQTLGWFRVKHGSMMCSNKGSKRVLIFMASDSGSVCVASAIRVSRAHGSRVEKSGYTVRRVGAREHKPRCLV